MSRRGFRASSAIVLTPSKPINESTASEVAPITPEDEKLCGSKKGFAETRRPSPTPIHSARIASRKNQTSEAIMIVFIR